MQNEIPVRFRGIETVVLEFLVSPTPLLCYINHLKIIAIFFDYHKKPI
jgi:hypothetical protein